MQVFEDKAQEYIRQRCREHLDYRGKLLGRILTFDYRYEHTRTAVAIAGSLAREVGVDPVLARIAAWLHDLAKCWEPSLTEAENRERAENHGPAGGREAAAFLLGLGFPSKLTGQVEQAIANHVGYLKGFALETPLDALLWDADKLTKVGVAGCLHFLGANLTLREKFIDLEEFFAEPDLELHRGIRDSLNTEAARRWADRAMATAAAFRRQALAAFTGSPGP